MPFPEARQSHRGGRISGLGTGWLPLFSTPARKFDQVFIRRLKSPAQRAGRTEPKASAKGRCPGCIAKAGRGLKGRESCSEGQPRRFSLPFRPHVWVADDPRASASGRSPGLQSAGPLGRLDGRFPDTYLYLWWPALSELKPVLEASQSSLSAARPVSRAACGAAPRRWLRPRGGRFRARARRGSGPPGFRTPSWC